jgi:AcrR family transcriptional regulator
LRFLTSFKNFTSRSATSAGLSSGAIYLYFKGKDDLLVSIFERSMSEVLAEGRQAVHGVADAAERLRLLARDRAIMIDITLASRSPLATSTTTAGQPPPQRHRRSPALLGTRSTIRSTAACTAPPAAADAGARGR